MSNFDNRLEEILEGVANEYSAGGNYENAKPLIVEEAEQAIRTLILEYIVDADTGVDLSEVLKKLYSDGYSNGYNDRTYENIYDANLRSGESIAPAIAKIRGRYDKQYKIVKGEHNATN